MIKKVSFKKAERGDVLAEYSGWIPIKEHLGLNDDNYFILADAEEMDKRQKKAIRAQIAKTDSDMIKALEEIVEVFTGGGVLNLTDLSLETQDAITNRKALRAKL